MRSNPTGDHLRRASRISAGAKQSCRHSCISGTWSAIASLASVPATICSMATPGPRSSSVATPFGNAITASSLTTRSTGRTEVSGSEHLLTIFGLPLAVCCIATITRLAPVTRSMAPPMPGTILPGIIQFASVPCASTCSAPSTVMSTWPPRMRPNDIALSNVQAPGSAVTGRPPASVRVGWAIPSSGIGPVPIRPFSDWKNTVMPAGTKFATMVGMPMRRLASMQDCSSRAMRLAMTVCASMMSPVCDEVIDQRRGGRDVVGRDDADRNDVVRRHDGGVRGHGHDRVEVARGQRVGEVAQIVGEKRMDEREIRAQRRLEQIILPLDLDPLLALLDDGADARWREHATEPVATGADAFDQRALRHKLDFHRLGNHLPLGLGIEADVAGDGPADKLGVDQLANAASGHGIVVG